MGSWGNPSGENRIFSHPLHANSLLSQLNETRKNPTLCDGVVVIQDKEIPIQRNVLSAASLYFRCNLNRDGPFDIRGEGTRIFPRDKLFFLSFCTKRYFFKSKLKQIFFIF